MPAPSWCATDGIDFYVYRTESCGVFSGSLTVTNLQTGVPIGQIFFNIVDYSYTSATIATWAHQIQIEETSQWGQVSGTTVDGITVCVNHCASVNGSFPAQPVALNSFDNGEGYYTTDATAPGAIGDSSTSWIWTFHNPAWTPPSTNPSGLTQVDVRCDNALPGVTSVGCVFPLFNPVMIYQLSGPFPQLAQHIQDAQGSGLPGAYTSGSPLTRLTDPNLQKQNRDTACPDSLIRPPGDSCDEYPFASTYQGAAMSGGGPRTFPWCQITLQTQSTGPNGYSICMIDLTQNTVGGLALGRFYNANRVLDGDPFFVWIQP